MQHSIIFFHSHAFPADYLLPHLHSSPPFLSFSYSPSLLSHLSLFPPVCHVAVSSDISVSPNTGRDTPTTVIVGTRGQDTREKVPTVVTFVQNGGLEGRGEEGMGGVEGEWFDG